MNLIYYLLITLTTSYNLPINIPNRKIRVYVHLEQFNQKHNLFHIGISFNSEFRNIRFDYRSFNDDYSYITTNKNRHNLQLMFPRLNIPEEYEDQEFKTYRELLLDNTNNRYRKDILWGFTNKTFDEILTYEKNLHKKYIIGIYDCRHYVHEFTDWSLNKPTPVWTLYKLWNNPNL